MYQGLSNGERERKLIYFDVSFQIPFSPHRIGIALEAVVDKQLSHNILLFSNWSSFKSKRKHTWWQINVDMVKL